MNKQQVVQFVQGLADVFQSDPNEIFQIAQQNPEAFEAAVQTYQQTSDMKQAAQAFQEILSQKTKAAKHGAKLNYLKTLKHQCAEDEELVYYKKGGRLDCGCKKKGGEIKKEQTPVQKFKSSIKKDCGGSKMKMIKKGDKVCPKCGKIHAAGIGCSVAKFKEFIKK